ARLPLENGLAQVSHILLQIGAPCLSWQGNDEALQYIEKFQLFLVFASVDHLASGNGGRVVSADITDQMQRLRGVERFANGEKAEAGQQRQHQPRKRETETSHQCIPNENGWH